MSRELDILAKMLSSLSEDERQELLDKVGDNKEKFSRKKSVKKKFNEEEYEENDRYREISKKLTKTANKSVRPPARDPVKKIDYTCPNCGKVYELPTNYPGGVKNFICCVR